MKGGFTMDYELRVLKAQDIFIMTKIISAIGVKEFKSCFESDEVKKMLANMSNGEKNDELASSIGISVFMDITSIIISNLSACEGYIYKFLSSLSGIPEKDIAELPMVVFTQMIIDVIKKEEFKDFIGAVSEFLK